MKEQTVRLQSDGYSFFIDDNEGPRLLTFNSPESAVRLGMSEKVASQLFKRTKGGYCIKESDPVNATINCKTKGCQGGPGQCHVVKIDPNTLDETDLGGQGPFALESGFVYVCRCV